MPLENTFQPLAANLSNISQYCNFNHISGFFEKKAFLTAFVNYIAHFWLFDHFWPSKSLFYFKSHFFVFFCKFLTFLTQNAHFLTRKALFFFLSPLLSHFLEKSHFWIKKAHKLLKLLLVLKWNWLSWGLVCLPIYIINNI